MTIGFIGEIMLLLGACIYCSFNLGSSCRWRFVWNFLPFVSLVLIHYSGSDLPGFVLVEWCSFLSVPVFVFISFLFAFFCFFLSCRVTRGCFSEVVSRTSECNGTVVVRSCFSINHVILICKKVWPPQTLWRLQPGDWRLFPADR